MVVVIVPGISGAVERGFDLSNETLRSSGVDKALDLLSGW